MFKTRFPRMMTLLLALVAALALMTGSIAAADSQTTLTVLHVNDLHARLEPFAPATDAPVVGGMARIAAKAFAIRAEQPGKVLLLSAGDMIHGTNIANLFGGRSVIETMNLAGFDAMTLGNHEFNYGQEALLALGEQALFPFLGANITNAEGQPYVKPYIIKEVNKLKVAILGLSAEETPVVTHPKNVAGMTFADPIATAKELVKIQEIQEADLILALTHIGAELDRQLAAEVPEIDVIVGGHSHTQIDKAEKIGETLYVQAGEHGKYLGRLDLTVTNGQVVSSNYLLLPVDANATPVAGIQAVIDTYNASLKDMMNVVVGEAYTNLYGAREEVRTSETNLGNLVADIMRQAVGADIAFENGGGIRASIAQGEVTVGDIFTVLPFDNTLVLIEVTGEQIMQALEVGVGKYPAQLGGFLQVSGMSFVFDPSKPEGQRVVSATVGGAALDRAKMYTLAVNDFMAAGGDGYVMFKGAKVLAHTGEMLRDVAVRYFQSVKGVNPQIEGRITVKK